MQSVNNIYSFIEGEGSFTTPATEKIEDDFLVRVSPNPFEDFLDIQIDDHDVSKILMFNVLGEKIKEIDLMNHTTAFRLELKNQLLSEGIYFLKVEAGKKQQIIKVVKKQ